MSRKKFILSHGATCANWTWSWSFINTDKKTIIFGAWDTETQGDVSIILKESWYKNLNGRKSPGYPQSREHVRLIEEEGYQLKTFPIKNSPDNKDEDGFGPAKIECFEALLSDKVLKKVDDSWYASDDKMGNSLPEEIDNPIHYPEGTVKTISINSYERSSSARKECLEKLGYKCVVCSFNFEKNYGSIGKNYIHVHHVIPISEIKMGYNINPIKDLVPICPNCHAIIHRTRPALTVEQLKKHLRLGGSNT